MIILQGYWQSSFIMNDIRFCRTHPPRLEAGVRALVPASTWYPLLFWLWAFSFPRRKYSYGPTKSVAMVRGGIWKVGTVIILRLAGLFLDTED
jgi:hypothetical protein